MKNPLPDAFVHPSHETVIEGLYRTIDGRSIDPAASAARHMNDAANCTPIIHSSLALHVGGKGVTLPKIGSAKNFDPELEKAGFQAQNETGYVPQKGDIVVISRMQGENQMGISPLMTGSSGSRTSGSATSGAATDTGPNSPRIDFIGSLLSVCLLFAVAGREASAEDVTCQGFHFPSTSAEQFLDLIITLESGTGRAELGAYAKSVPWRDTRKDVRYARLITPGLRDAISREETRQVKENCGGEYVEGDNCSFGTNPITCSQDHSEEGHLFRTDTSGRNEAVISLGWPGFSEIIGAYRLVRTGGVWKLDGIRCDSTMWFNMP